MSQSQRSYSTAGDLQERPDLSEMKANLMLNNAKMKAELSLLEDTILQMLSASQGNILDDENLITTLAVSKVCCLTVPLTSQADQIPCNDKEALAALHTKCQTYASPMSVSMKLLTVFIKQISGQQHYTACQVGTGVLLQATSNDIASKVEEAERTEQEIDEAREQYRSVAVRASLLFFCIADLAGVDPMYQYSLAWFVALFLRTVEATPEVSDHHQAVCDCIKRGVCMNAVTLLSQFRLFTFIIFEHAWLELHVSLQAESVEERSKALNEAFTYALFINVCRSLFEAHKLMFSFLLAVKILQNRKEIDPGMLLTLNHHALYMPQISCVQCLLDVSAC